VTIGDGPSMIRSENGRLSAYVYIDVRGRDLASVVGDLQRAVAAEVTLPAGASVAYSGQFEYLARASERLLIVGPATLAIIFLLLYLTFRRFDEAALVMASLPFALMAGCGWFMRSAMISRWRWRLVSSRLPAWRRNSAW
jgi:copper/silver efflux system protein